MRVIVSLEAHFGQIPDGSIYVNCVYDYNFLRRYLDVFDEALVFARVHQVKEGDLSTVPLKASGPGIRFFPLPDYLGPWQYLRCWSGLKALAKQALRGEDACVLRVPGPISTLLWRELIKASRPYGVEVVGDGALVPGSVKSILRPVLRWKMRWELTKQCRMASAASYVTEYSLQKRYPPGCWSTHYSSIELSPQSIVNDRLVEERIRTISRKHDSKGPWRICYAGSMANLMKAPDVLIDAVAECIGGGINLELVMLGDGQFRASLEHRAQKLGIGDSVKFLGRLPSGQPVYEQLDKADLYVMPSRQEGLPRSVIEAMARGLPCVTSNVGGFPELVESQYMVKPDDVSGLAETIAKTISNAEEMKRLVRRGVEIALKYRSDILQKRRVKFYCELRDITQDWLNNHKK